MGTNMIAYLKTNGFQEVDIEYTPNGKIKYWFIDCDELHDEIRKFQKDELIQKFINCQINIKSKIIELRDKHKQ